MSHRVFVVEDHPYFREALIESLNDIEDIEVAGFSESGEMALVTLPELNVDIAVVDVSLPRMNGFECAAAITKRHPHIRCLMLSGHKTKGVVDRARELGLYGYVVKGDLSQFKQALRNVMSGKKYFSEIDGK